MRIEFSPGDVEALIKHYGLPAGATAEQVADRVMMRVTEEDDPLARARDRARRRAGTPNRGRLAQPTSAEGEQLISAAVAAGKFPASRTDHYRRRFARDPQGTADLIGRMAPVELGNPELWADAGQADNVYPREWLRSSDGDQRRSRVTSGD